MITAKPMGKTSKDCPLDRIEFGKISEINTQMTNAIGNSKKEHVAQQEKDNRSIKMASVKWPGGVHKSLPIQ